MIEISAYLLFIHFNYACFDKYSLNGGYHWAECAGPWHNPPLLAATQ